MTRIWAAEQFKISYKHPTGSNFSIAEKIIPNKSFGRLDFHSVHAHTIIKIKIWIFWKKNSCKCFIGDQGQRPAMMLPTSVGTHEQAINPIKNLKLNLNTKRILAKVLRFNRNPIPDSRNQVSIFKHWRNFIMSRLWVKGVVVSSWILNLINKDQEWQPWIPSYFSLSF